PSSGVFYAQSREGETETISYRKKNDEKAREHIKTMYPLCDDSSEPARIPPELYDELSLALIKYDFGKLEIVIDNEFFDFFSYRPDDIYPCGRSLAYKNVHFDADQSINDTAMQDFFAVLDVTKVAHLCDESKNRKAGCKSRKTDVRCCSCIRFRDSLTKRNRKSQRRRNSRYFIFL
ncbi:hypothetical protein PENTCL1PPCAC_9967, partial [Pristionchus entomophagus]